MELVFEVSSQLWFGFTLNRVGISISINFPFMSFVHAHFELMEKVAVAEVMLS